MVATPSLSARGAVLLLVIGLGLTSISSLRHLADPYADHYHGGLTAWFAMMSESMAESGFRETRLMPPINPEKSTYPSFRYYITHPVLDVVLRAALMRVFGAGEWVARLQGVAGCFGAAALFFFVARRRLGPLGSLGAACGMAALPLFQRLAQLSMHHPMTLFFGMLALLAYLSWKERRTRAWAVLMTLALVAGMGFDWPGYFMLALIWLLECASRGRRSKAILMGLPVLALAGIGLHVLHVNVICDRDLWAAMRRAQSNPDAALDARAWWRRVGRDLVAGYSWFGVGAVAASAVLIAALPHLRRARLASLWAALFVYGAANYFCFPAKAPFEDFWGAYFLPLGGLACGIVVEAVAVWMTPRFGMKAQLLLAGLVLGVASTSAFLVRWDAAAVARGAEMKKTASALRELIPPEDRGLLLTNFIAAAPESSLPKILMAYARMNIAVVDVAPHDLEKLPSFAETFAFHLRGRRCLFFVNDGAPDKERSAALASALAKVGTPYRGVPGFFDITSFVWR
jgi:hypothetical protein